VVAAVAVVVASVAVVAFVSSFVSPSDRRGFRGVDRLSVLATFPVFSHFPP
jgi:hypothetical protein